jgi:hypothetical protein
MKEAAPPHATAAAAGAPAAAPPTYEVNGVVISAEAYARAEAAVAAFGPVCDVPLAPLPAPPPPPAGAEPPAHMNIFDALGI